MTSRTLRTRKTPSVNRSLWVLMCAAMSFPQLAAGQELSESDVIRLALAHAPASAVADASDSLADARARTAGAFVNPSVAWSRETVESGAVGSQDIVTLNLPIDIARPRATRSLVESQSAWMQAEAAMTRADAVLEAVLAFHEVGLAQRRVDVLTASVANLREAARVLQRREAAGTASGYDSTRFVVASELSRSRLADARGTLRRAKMRLASLVGVHAESLRVAATPAVLSVAEAERLAERGSGSHGAVRRAQASRRLATRARERAGWAWLPTLELEAGMKHVSDLGGGYGYVVGVSLNIPIFDRGQALRAEAGAMRALSAARAQAVSRSLDLQIETALASFRAAREELERFETRIAGQVEALLSAVRSGYSEGHRTIVELLDAQRAETEVAERSLTLLGDAKRAETRLRAATGDLQ